MIRKSNIKETEDTPFIILIYAKIVEEWTLSTELDNPSQFMEYVNYCTTAYAFSILFQKHLDRQIKISTNHKCEDIFHFQRLKKQINDPVSILMVNGLFLTVMR